MLFSALKNRIVPLFVTLVMVISSTGLSYASQVAVIRAMGNTSTKTDNAQKVATEDAKRKAVKKAIDKVISQSNNDALVGKQLLNNYQKYVAGAHKVIRKQTINGKVVVTCDVPVDYEKVFADVKAILRTEQNTHLNETVAFFVRLNGSGDKLKDANYADDAFGQYNAAFRSYGFQVEEIEVDEYNNPNVNFTDLKSKIFTFTGNSKNYAKYAVVSDIKVTKISVGQPSFAEVSIYSEAYVRNGNNFVLIGKFVDNFSGTQGTVNAAIDYATQRASINSAKYLADLTYNSWKNSK